MNKYVSFRAHKGKATNVRVETWLGKEYTVVPVVALVEGVLQGMNAETPELALAEEFGRFPDGWNGRPIVMNHPVVNKIAVSANSPDVLEKYAFGMIFNSVMDDGKLKVEAWLDNARIEEMGGEVAEVLDRVNNGDIIEVSTGLYTQVEEKKGRFNSRNYQKIWRNIVPDHLAFLSEGVKGACSVADGCGTRANSQQDTTTTSTVPLWEAFSLNDAGIATSAGDCGCGCNGAGTCKESDMSEKTTTTEGQITDNHTTQNEGGGTTEKPSFDFGRFIANAYPDAMVSNDVLKLLNGGIREKLGTESYAYVLGFTKNMAIYESYRNSKYKTFQRSFNIGSDNKVTFGDDETEVNILMNVQPKVNSADENQPKQMETERQMSEKKDDTQAASAPAGETDPKAVTMNSTATVETPKTPKTMAEYLGEMPEEMREVISSGLKLHNQKKEGLIKALKDTGRCKFSDEALKAMSMDMLQNLAELSEVPTFEGTASPRVQSEDDSIPMPPALFPVN